MMEDPNPFYRWSFDPDSRQLDITGEEDLKISIRSDGKVLWINSKDGCILRICRISGKIVIDDKRRELKNRGGKDET